MRQIAPMQKLLVVTGPTASGKSALALRLAQALAGTIINADSMQVYADLPILTAQPDAAERSLVPHRLYGTLDGDDACSAARWAGLAAEEIAAAATDDRLPILTGGSGLYLKALLQGLAPVPEVSAEIRHAAETRLAALGHAAFHAALVADDPGSGHLRVGDTQRLVRAWSVLQATGRSLGSWHAEGQATPRRYDTFIILLQPERATLYAAIDNRLAGMVRAGALTEVAALASRNLPPDRPVLKAHGAPEITRHLAGEISLTNAVQRGALNTRHYAKRQTTWFRHQNVAENLVS